MSDVKSQILFGSVINLQSGSASESYLATCGKIKDNTSFNQSPEQAFVLTCSKVDGTQGSGAWEISSASGKTSGEPLLYGDKIYLLNLYPGAGYLDTCQYTTNITSFSSYPEMIGVFTNSNKNRDHGSGTWTVSSVTNIAIGTPVKEGDIIVLINGYSHAGKLQVYGSVKGNTTFAGYDEAKSFVFSDNERTDVSDSDRSWIISNGVEFFDTSDSDTATLINNSLKQFKINSLIDTTQGTIKGGYVFCDFSDAIGSPDDIKKNYNILNGIDGNKNIVTDFIKKESNGKVSLEMTIHAETSNKWLRLPNANTAYKDKVDKLFADVDSLIDIPTDWSILFLAFPKGATTISASQMCGDRIVDTNHKLNIVFLDPALFNEPDNNTPWTTVHEVMHALSLPDLYETSSYGWSLMSDCRTGWHITGFEKLVLGWHKLSDYYFLKRGIVRADIFSQDADEGKKKGIIIMPDDVRKECYFIEKSQPVGRTEDDLNSFNRNGLLLMVADLKLRDINPFVAERSFPATGSKFGGAEKAPFINDQRFSTMGVSLFYINSSPYVSVDSSYTVTNAAKSLRDNEYIKIPDKDVIFKIDMFGMLTSGSNRLKKDGKLLDGKSTKGNDYGYAAYVDRNGIFYWIAGIGQDDSQKKTLYTFGPSSPLPDGDYFFRIEADSQSNNYRVAIYSGLVGNSGAEYKYTLFTILEPDIIRGWETTKDANGCIVRFQRDGNLCLYSKNDDNSETYRWSLYSNKETRKPAFAEWGETGNLTFYYDDDEVAKEFSGTPSTKKPFTIKSKASDGKYVIVVNDNENTELYSINEKIN